MPGGQLHWASRSLDSRMQHPGWRRQGGKASSIPAASGAAERAPVLRGCHGGPTPPGDPERQALIRPEEPESLLSLPFGWVPSTLFLRNAGKAPSADARNLISWKTLILMPAERHKLAPKRLRKPEGTWCRQPGGASKKHAAADPGSPKVGRAGESLPGLRQWASQTPEGRAEVSSSPVAQGSHPMR